jgi:hypothetical protein
LVGRGVEMQPINFPILSVLVEIFIIVFVTLPYSGFYMARATDIMMQY